ncbi:MAG: HAMP domain-containing protein [Kofleriaceae bacterium]
MRTLSARIILGFAVLTVMFGVITATVVVNMRQIEDQVLLILKGYVKLALESKDLARSQDDLRTFVEERFTQEPTPEAANLALNRHRASRDRGLKDTRNILARLEKLIDVERKQFAKTRPQLDDLERAVAAVDPLYKLVLERPPIGDPAVFDDKQKVAAMALEKLRSEERKFRHLTNQLSDQLERSVTTTTQYLEHNEASLRMRTIWFGIAAVTLGLLITGWVVVTLRPLRRLGEAARKIASGDYANRIPRRPAEVSTSRASSTRWAAPSRSASASWSARSGWPRSARWPR